MFDVTALPMGYKQQHGQITMSTVQTTAARHIPHWFRDDFLRKYSTQDYKRYQARLQSRTLEASNIGRDYLR